MLGDIGSIIQAAATVVGVLIGGAWAVYLFVNRRGRFPRANVTHHVTANRIWEDHVLLRIKVTMANVGEVLFKIDDGIVRVNQILPVRDDILAEMMVESGIKNFNLAETKWPDLVDWTLDWNDGERPEIEPNEIDEFNFDFIIPAETKLIEIYTYFGNMKKRSTRKSPQEMVIAILMSFKNFRTRSANMSPREIGWGHTSTYDLTDLKILPNDESNC